MPSIVSSERRYFLRASPRPSARGMRAGSCGTGRGGLQELCELLCFELTILASFLPRVHSRVSSSATGSAASCSGGRAHAGSLYVKRSMSMVFRYVLTRCLSTQAIAIASSHRNHRTRRPHPPPPTQSHTCTRVCPPRAMPPARVLCTVQAILVHGTSMREVLTADASR